MKHPLLIIFLLINTLALAQHPTELEQALSAVPPADNLAPWMKIARSDARTPEAARAYTILADAVAADNFAAGMRLHLHALEIGKALGNDTLMAKSLLNLGYWTEQLQGPLDSALNYYRQAQQVLRTPKDAKFEAMSLLNQANMYARLSNIDSLRSTYLGQAVACDSQAEQILSNQPYTALKADNAYGIAQRSLLQSRNSDDARQAAAFRKKAETYFLKAKAYYQTIGASADNSTLLCLNGLVGVAFYEADKSPYRKYLTEGIQLAEKNADTISLLNLLYNSEEIEQQDYNAAAALSALTRFKDLMVKSGLVQDTTFLRAFYEDVRVVPMAAIQNPLIFVNFIDDKLAALQVKVEDEHQKRQQRIALWGLGSTLILGLFAFQYYRHRERLEKQQLLLKQEEMESLVADSEAKAKEKSLTAETNARQGIRRELHDGAAAIMAAARWSFEAKIEQLEAENNPLAADLRTNLELQNRAYLALRNAIHRTEQDPVSWVDELRLFCTPLPGVSLIEYNLEEVPNGQFGRKCLNMTRELIANALKYARASKIEVQLARLDDELLSITVSDNGDGFDVKTIPVLQQRTDASLDATLPVENLPEVGAHGLDNVHRYVFELGGEIEVTSQLGEGTNVVIELPLPQPTL